MTTTSTLYGLDKPDEQADLKLKDANRKEIVEKTYEAWFKNTHIDVLEAGEPAYRQACNIIGPFKERIKGTLYADEFSFMADSPKNQFSFLENCGYYFSALLNETDIDTLHVRKLPSKTPEKRDMFIDGLGYRLKPGKALIISSGVRTGPKRSSSHRFTKKLSTGHLGKFAEGGIIINHGSKCGFLGYRASDGIFLNYGFVDSAAVEAKGGIWIDYYAKFGEVRTKHTSRGFPVGIGSFGNRASGGVFISKGHRNPDNITEHAYGIKKGDLEKDTVLKVLVDLVEEAGKEAEISRINPLAREIDEHVRKKYPRRIA